MRDLGDIQTPLSLVAEICDVLARHGRSWSRLLDPTCGQGNMIVGVLADPRFAITEVHGIEVQSAHLQVAQQRVTQGWGDIPATYRPCNVFTVDFRHDLQWQHQGPLLVLGNPPWGVPSRKNMLTVPKQTRVPSGGFAAQTGASNLDQAAHVILKCVAELAEQSPTIAMLCKVSVVRSVMTHLWETQMPIVQASYWEIDASHWFKIGIERACLFVLQIEPGTPCDAVAGYASLQAETPHTVLRIRNGMVFNAIRDSWAEPIGHVAWHGTWRQGLKHDAAAVLELTRVGSSWMNKLGESVDIEAERVFPLVKGRAVYHNRLHHVEQGVILPYTDLRGDPESVARQFPAMWAYLERHAAVFCRRKSSVYRGRPPFALFGIGRYSFAPYKIAVAGLYAVPRFRLVCPYRGQPVMLDDTCYAWAWDTLLEAALALALLDHEESMQQLRPMIFSDAKRPITKRILEQVDLAKAYAAFGTERLIDAAQQVCECADHDRAEWTTALATVMQPWERGG